MPNMVVNPKNSYAMQPIVMKYYNSQGVSDFIYGLMPNMMMQEDYKNLIAFGDQNETLLKACLNDITGMPQSGMVIKSAGLGIKKVFDSQENRPFSKQMYINSLPKFNKK